MMVKRPMLIGVWGTSDGKISAESDVFCLTCFENKMGISISFHGGNNMTEIWRHPSFQSMGGANL